MYSGTHVLVVDDEDDFRDSVALLLALEGFRVSAVPNGQEALRFALAAAPEDRVDVFLLDYRMPGLDGVQTLLELQAHGVRACMILVSAAAEVLTRAPQHGFDDAVSKPFSLDQLLSAIRGCSPPAEGRGVPTA